MDFGLVNEQALRVRSITANRTLADASNQVSYTGLGFRPDAIWSTCKLNGTTVFSVGFIDFENDGGGNGLNGATWTGGLGSSGNAILVSANTSSGNGAIAIFSSYDADGFTLDWIKTGSPVGFIGINFMCFRGFQ